MTTFLSARTSRRSKNFSEPSNTPPRPRPEGAAALTRVVREGRRAFEGPGAGGLKDEALQLRKLLSRPRPDARRDKREPKRCDLTAFRQKLSPSGRSTLEDAAVEPCQPVRYAFEQLLVGPLFVSVGE